MKGHALSILQNKRPSRGKPPILTAAFIHGGRLSQCPVTFKGIAEGCSYIRSSNTLGCVCREGKGLAKGIDKEKRCKSTYGNTEGIGPFFYKRTDKGHVNIK